MSGTVLSQPRGGSRWLTRPRSNSSPGARRRKLREADAPPKTAAEWDRRRKELRERVLAAAGPVPEKACDLEPRNLGTLERDGYRIEKLVFQVAAGRVGHRLGLRPSLKDGEKAPAVLVVHGHWAGARRDPVVQARCLGLGEARLLRPGRRCLRGGRAVHHAGPRHIPRGPVRRDPVADRAHAARDAGVRQPPGRRLPADAGPKSNGKLGITGASGGGNQSMYAGALDERFAAVVPVCSVGNYQAYLRAACCVCEVLPDALTFTEEGDVLGLVAPRALIVMNATSDGIQFSPRQAEKSVGRTRHLQAARRADRRSATSCSTRPRLQSGRCARPCTAG